MANDQDIIAQVNQLVAEEQDLRGKLQHHQIDESGEHRRLQSIGVHLDQSWDLLRQRRALRAGGGDPDDAQVRPASEADGHLG